MLIDQELQFSKDQTITDTVASSNVIDIGVARDIGLGDNLWLHILVTETLDDSGDNSTITPSLQTDDNEAFGSATTLRTLTAIAANTAAGTEYRYRLEPGSFEKYVRLYYTVANGVLTAGKISAQLVLDVPKQTNYTSGFSVT